MLRIVPLAEDDGKPFVEPTTEPIANGWYPLSRFVSLDVNKASNAKFDPLRKRVFEGHQPSGRAGGGHQDWVLPGSHKEGHSEPGTPHRAPETERGLGQNLQSCNMPVIPVKSLFGRVGVDFIEK